MDDGGRRDAGVDPDELDPFVKARQLTMKSANFACGDSEKATEIREQEEYSQAVRN